MQNHGLGMDCEKNCEDSTMYQKYIKIYSADLSKTTKIFGILLKNVLIGRS